MGLYKIDLPEHLLKEITMTLEDWKSYKTQIVHSLKTNLTAVDTDRSTLLIVDAKIKKLEKETKKEKV